MGNGGSTFSAVGRLVILVTIGAIAAYGFVWTSKPRGLDTGFMFAASKNSVADEGAGTSHALNNTGVNAPSLNVGSFRTAAIPKAAMMRPRDEAPPADRPQAHAPIPWPASGAAAPREANMPAPADTGLLPAEAEIQTAPPVSTAPRINDEGIANLLPSGRTFLMIGDVTAARLAFRRAAESGDAQAALALGGTFDPRVLKSLGAVGVTADPAQARGWYQKAAELGSGDAPKRLNRLAQSVQ
jgi:hypothetical protein